MDKKKLKELNFKNLLTIDTDIEKYTFEEYAKNGYIHPKITKMCTLCEEEGVNICTSDKSYRLKTMGHGTMTDDILTATGQKDITERSKWRKKGVIFLLINPGPLDDNIYKQVEYNSYKKFPTYRWYWLNQRSVKQRNPEKCEYPNFFQGRKYCEFFTSVLFTFKLKNMYITDLIKCGMNNEGKDYTDDINKYNQKCIENCLEHYFNKEIQLVKPKIIFCFGDITCNKIEEIKKTFKHDYKIKKLSHPGRWGFLSIEFQKEYYNKIAEGLREAKIISPEEESDYIKRGYIKVLEEISQFLERKGFEINELHNNYIISKKINGIYFCIQNNEKKGLRFHWGNGGEKKLNYEWFIRKNNEILKLFPNSEVIKGKNQKWIRLFINIPENQYKKNILEIIKKTRGIMEYQ